MVISSQFNRYYHAMLGDILRSGKEIEVTNNDFYCKIYTKHATVEQLKMFFKLSDVEYVKTIDEKYKKNVFGLQSDELYSFFGIPISIKELSSSNLSRHVRWISSICSENKINISSPEWDSFMRYIEEVYEK